MKPTYKLSADARLTPSPQQITDAVNYLSDVCPEAPGRRELLTEHLKAAIDLLLDNEPDDEAANSLVRQAVAYLRADEQLTLRASDGFDYSRDIDVPAVPRKAVKPHLVIDEADILHIPLGRWAA